MTRGYAKSLRKNLTEAERRLWYILRAHRFQGFKFKRQVPIGRYIVDFACLEHRLIVEVDGGQHADSPLDAERDAWLESQGFHIRRFWNNDVLSNTNGVLETIVDALSIATKKPSPGSAFGRSTLSHGAMQVHRWGRGEES